MMYTAKLPKDRGWRESLEWCEQQLGPATAMSYGNAWLKGARWWRLNNLICFRDEKDLTFFLLRWT
jgi:hypothetical protein